MDIFKTYLAVVASIMIGGSVAGAQTAESVDTLNTASSTVGELVAVLSPDSLAVDSLNVAPPTGEERAMWLINAFNADTLPADCMPEFVHTPLPSIVFAPTVYHDFKQLDPTPLKPLDESKINDALKWAERATAQADEVEFFMQNYTMTYPRLVKYNINNLPEPPKQFVATVDPKTATIVVSEVTLDKKKVAGDGMAADLKKKHWLHGFNGALQFSQAFVSPNWYQGGNNNVNLIADLLYTFKLNPAFHPNLLFENSAQYKLAINSTPEDKNHAYNLSQNMLQINSKFGLKAVKHWYYSVTFLLKTPIFDGYKKGTDQLTAAFLSPGELNLGVGMTYNMANKKKTFTFDASISPLSYNLKTLLDGRMKAESYGIEAGHKTANQIGSSAEMKWTWKIAYNISWSSRVFAFTDYEYGLVDWQNTVTFNINRFLSTNLYLDMRYDSSAKRSDKHSWYRFQMREILSFGFSYKI